MFCQEQVAQLRQSESRVERAGARLVVIGNGSPHFIAGFREKSGFEGAIYTDPERRTYRAMHLRRDVKSSFNLRTIGRAIGAYRKGNRQTSTQGDPWQQGGVFVIAASGEVLYSYPSEYAGDHPPIAAIMRTLERAQTG